MPDPPVAALVAPNTPQVLVARDTPNILVLVGGTVDPVNTGDEHRSAGYSRPGRDAGDPSYWARPEADLVRDGVADGEHWYWQDNDGLRASIDALRTSYTNLMVFTAHGWSGDNSVANRRIAGQYLADRLCGANGERPYYQRYLAREVHFHLLGHSHGGNVINELLHRAASVWPAGWKVRSVTYLSTPFFQTLSQIDTTTFDPDCKIINVTNDYDLTQRVAADFSLFQLNDILTLHEFGDAQTAFDDFMTELTAGMSVFATDTEPFLRSVRPVDADPSWWYRPELRFDAAQAEPLYRALLNILARLGPLLDSASRVVDGLYRGVEYPAALEFVGRVSQGRRVISDALRGRFHTLLDEMRAAIAPTEAAVRRRLASRVYPVSGVLDDFDGRSALALIAEKVQIGPATSGEPAPGSLRGPLIDLVIDLIREQIDVFDDTRRTPDHQLTGTLFDSHVVGIDVTSRDAYRAHRAFSRRFPRLVARLETIEARYARRRLPDDLMDLLLTLLAQMEPVRDFVAAWSDRALQMREAFDWASTQIDAPPTSILGQLSRMFSALDTWLAHLRERDAGGLEVVPTARSRYASRASDPAEGTLDYLMRVSHSQSRFELYDDVRAELEAQFTTRRRRRAGTAP